MTSLADLCVAAPWYLHGVPSGVEGWNFSVELAMPSWPGSLLGIFELGTSELSSMQWYDVTERVRGVQISRGGSPGDRPEPGTLLVELDNQDKSFSPWTDNDYFLGSENAYLGPGTLIRVSVHEVPEDEFTETWLPLSTCIVEQWDESVEGLGAKGNIIVTGIETLSVLAQYNTNAITPVGAADDPETRIERLGDAAGWQFGYNLEYGGPVHTFQSTDMADNRLAELYLTADSVDELLKAGRDGRIWFGQRDARSVDPDDVFFSAGAPRLVLSSASLTDPLYVPASIDDFRTVNNDDLLISKVTLARAGGSAVEYENTFISGRYQTRTYTRSDLITQNPGADADLEYVAERILARSEDTFRPDSIRLDGKLHERVLKFIFSMDINHAVRIDTEEVIFLNYGICAYNINITPMSSQSIDVTADLRFETNTVSSWLRV